MQKQGRRCRSAGHFLGLLWRPESRTSVSLLVDVDYSGRNPVLACQTYLISLYFHRRLHKTCLPGQEVLQVECRQTKKWTSQLLRPVEGMQCREEKRASGGGGTKDGGLLMSREPVKRPRREREADC